MTSKCIGEIVFTDSEDGSAVTVNGLFHNYPYEQWANTIYRELSNDPEFRPIRKYLSYKILSQILEFWDTISDDNPNKIDKKKYPKILSNFTDEIYLFLDMINLQNIDNDIVINKEFIESLIKEWDRMLLDQLGQRGY